MDGASHPQEDPLPIPPPQPPQLPQSPLPLPLSPALDATHSLFLKLFPKFRPGIPITRAISEFKLEISIPFVWFQHDIPRSAILSFTATKTRSKWTVSFDPFKSLPQPHQTHGIEWIRLYFVEFHPCFSALEAALQAILSADAPN